LVNFLMRYAGVCAPTLSIA